jgi:hypothetical protein
MTENDKSFIKVIGFIVINVILFALTYHFAFASTFNINTNPFVYSCGSADTVELYEYETDTTTFYQCGDNINLIEGYQYEGNFLNGVNVITEIPPFIAIASIWVNVPTGNINNPVTVELNLDPQIQLDQDILSNSLWGLEFWGLDVDGYPSQKLSEQCYSTNAPQGTFTFTGDLTPRSYAVIAIVGSETCESVSSGGVITIGDLNQVIPLFTVLENSGGGGSIWSGNNGFWGSTTISDFTTTMEASVQETGISIYALLTFVGIPIGFLIAFYLLNLINKELEQPQPEEITPKRKRGRPRKTIINPQGEDLISHSASDLEFKRNYGRSKNK